MSRKSVVADKRFEILSNGERNRNGIAGFWSTLKKHPIKFVISMAYAALSLDPRAFAKAAQCSVISRKQSLPIITACWMSQCSKSLCERLSNTGQNATNSDKHCYKQPSACIKTFGLASHCVNWSHIRFSHWRRPRYDLGTAPTTVYMQGTFVVPDDLDMKLSLHMLQSLDFLL